VCTRCERWWRGGIVERPFDIVVAAAPPPWARCRGAAAAGRPLSPATPPLNRDLSQDDGVKIGVVSDTHLPRFGRALPRALVAGLEAERVDLILHLGDMTGPEVPALFEAVAPFDGVAGNNDGDELVGRFARRKVVVAEGVRLGLVHGDQGPEPTTPRRAAGSFRAAEVDVVLFGHSHSPLLDRLADGRWLLNPGSPTDRRREPLFSWAVIEIGDGAVRPEIRYFDDRRT
jgi:putative phosphoesterase